MSFLHILVLAAVQGITEFLPISSSGHLLLVPLLTDWQDQGIELDIATHVGSLLAVILYFRADIFRMGKALAGVGSADDVIGGRQLFFHTVVGSIPVVIAGAILLFIVKIDLRSLLLIAMTTLFFGLALGVADYFFKGRRSLREMNSWDALFIGIFQIFALFPGTSRSGVTMTAALIRGLDRTTAAHFSMLLSIPVIFAAGIAATYKSLIGGDFSFGLAALLAAVVSFVIAYLVIRTLMVWINKIGFMPFVIYRIILGGALLAIYATA
ncbi:undecaprenyl-diphosphate phosphatase [Sneathiella glossodoripedis]|uniref:undecaprenyl-diphosphate phosphatase n=1 Tax=Sneathiella glossodoripedis TaxID=418853 RepID=UPI00046E803F|nr:undecaprenyl-diphosphate phosphatase [Sneathiella glossodoripedis]